MITLTFLLLFGSTYKPPVITACREVTESKYYVQWPIYWNHGEVYIMQTKTDETRRGVETNIFKKE